MTQLRHCKCGNSNYFDKILRDIGHRGSSFSDLDAITHDKMTQRFLLQEFKRQGEYRENAQHWMLRDFIGTVRKLPEHFTAWIVERRDDGRIGWAEYGQPEEIISVEEYQARFAAWWNNVEPKTPLTIAKPVVEPVAHPPVTIESMIALGQEMKW